MPHFTSSGSAVRQLMSKVATRTVTCSWAQVMTQNISVLCAQLAFQNKATSTVFASLNEI
jgi:hypothetical protein